MKDMTQIFKSQKKCSSTVYIDICHLPQANLFKNVVHLLYEKVNIQLLVRPRGKLKEIIEMEYPSLPIVCFGSYNDSLVKKIISNIQRELLLLKFFKKNKFDILMGVGSYFLSPISHLHNKPSIMFTDDFEHLWHFNLNKFLSTYFIFPKSIPINGRNIIKYNGYKELAYLHPNYFKSNRGILNEYDLEEERYVFIRMTTNTSINYRRQTQFIPINKWQEIIKYFKRRDIDVVLSLENKENSKFFKNSIILIEPINEFYSLIKYSLMLISSGDTMAREACILGVPSIYLGGRKMVVNKEFIEKKIMFTPRDFESVISTIEYIINNNIKKETKEIIDYAIKYKWDDTTQVIMDILLGTIYRDENLIEKYRYN